MHYFVKNVFEDFNYEVDLSAVGNNLFKITVYKPSVELVGQFSI